MQRLTVEKHGELIMDTETMIRQLNAIAEKHKDDFIPTFQTNISAICRDVVPKLELLAGYEKIGSLAECVDMAEKQTASPPYRREFGVHIDHVNKEYHCPRCGIAVNAKDTANNFATIKTRYCFHCGQKLDWRN